MIESGIRYAIPLNYEQVVPLFYERNHRHSPEVVIILDNLSGNAHRLTIEYYIINTVFREQLKIDQLRERIVYTPEELTIKKDELHVILPCECRIVINEETYAGFVEQLCYLEDHILPGTFQESERIECRSIMAHVRFNCDYNMESFVTLFPFVYNNKKGAYKLKTRLSKLLQGESLDEERFFTAFVGMDHFDDFDENAPLLAFRCEDPSATIVISKCGATTVVVYGNRTAFIKIHMAIMQRICKPSL